MNAGTLMDEQHIAQRVEALLGLPCRARFSRPDPDELDEDGEPFPTGWMELMVIVTDAAAHRLLGTEVQMNVADLTLNDGDFSDRILEPMVALLRYSLAGPPQ